MVAIVTGSGTGIGRATARVLAEHGADVVLAARRVELLERTAGEIQALGRKADRDTDRRHRRRGVRTSRRHRDGELGRVDVLVNNAGGSINKAPEDWSTAEWHQIVDLNLASVWFLSEPVAKPMLDQGKGAIVNISSGESFLALPMVAPYGAAKAGMNSLTRSLAAAWTPLGVRVNAVRAAPCRPRATATPPTRPTSRRTRCSDRERVGRIGQPDEIAYPVPVAHASLARNSTGYAISSGWPMRRSRFRSEHGVLREVGIVGRVAVALGLHRAARRPRSRARRASVDTPPRATA